ncbi:MAG TPA: hypothetical protein VGR26_03940 [Acidimicrobiales bacterium]|nr:hypothetical protein [Acidimicrobiales bacterium]
MTRIAIGPIRLRRIVVSLWIFGLVALDQRWPLSLAVLTLGCISAGRAALMRVELRDEEIVVVNFFRTIRVPRASVRRAGFAPARWFDQAAPLVLVGERGGIRANGVSTWARQIRWPDQPFVARTRILARVERFFERSEISFDYHDPLQPTRTEG